MGSSEGMVGEKWLGSQILTALSLLQEAQQLISNLVGRVVTSWFDGKVGLPGSSVLLHDPLGSKPAH